MDLQKPYDPSDNNLPKIVIVIAGPTGVGKTAVAIELAKHFKTEIISADSRQCYEELKIGVARPSEAELIEISHHFIASHSIQEDITAAYFEHYALQITHELFSHHQVIIMVGGTGLYVKAFCEGLDKVPEIDRMVRQRIVVGYEEHGIGWLHKELSEKDPMFSMEGEMQNPQRMMRALEVFDGTGHSILSFRKNQKAARDFNIIKIGLDLPREKLYDNINTRVDKMIGAGLLEEVMGLLPFRHLNALQTVGYSEIFDFLDGKTSFERAVELIKINSRQYAKRQLTWFRKDPGFTWVAPGELEKIIATYQSNY